MWNIPTSSKSVDLNYNISSDCFLWNIPGTKNGTLKTEVFCNRRPQFVSTNTKDRNGKLNGRRKLYLLCTELRSKTYAIRVWYTMLINLLNSTRIVKDSGTRHGNKTWCLKHFEIKHFSKDRQNRNKSCSVRESNQLHVAQPPCQHCCKIATVRSKLNLYCIES